MSSEADKQIGLRRRALSGENTATPTDFLLHNKWYNTQQKLEIQEIAKKMAMEKGLLRINAETMMLALREWKKTKSPSKKEDILKELEQLGY